MELEHVIRVMACLINIYLFPKAGRFVYTFRRINLHMSTFHSACYVSYGKQVLKPTMYNVIVKVNSFFLAIFFYVL